MFDISRGIFVNIFCFVLIDFGLLLVGFLKYLILLVEGNKGMSLYGFLFL